MLFDLVVVGGGAAGLATAVFAARLSPGMKVVVLDGARRLGAKILISGGGRCNVTNSHVSASDYWGGNRQVVASVLRAFPVSRTIAFFEEIGVALHEEERGKLFPDSNSARAVLDALLADAARVGVMIETGWAVSALEPEGDGCNGRWRALGGDGTRSLVARRAVLATGGLSVPKTGSDGRGLALAAALGHRLVPTTPALVPLLLDGDLHRPLSGISHEASIVIEANGRSAARLRGPLLWTHFGVSGPVALDASRHWARAATDGPVRARLSFVPDLDFSGAERELLSADGKAGSRRTVQGALAARLPAAVGEALLSALAMDGSQPLSQLPRDERRRLTHALVEWDLPIRSTRGYNYAEATAGGVALEEIDRRSMESRRHPGLHMVGEMLDVDGRLGGFNFQWAWSSAWVAAAAIARRRNAEAEWVDGMLKAEG
jgi:predicted Rossmann fold flavoprotein